MWCSREGRFTRVVCSTVPNRGKSLTPESRMVMLEESRAVVDRSDATQDPSEVAISSSLDVAETLIFALLVMHGVVDLCSSGASLPIVDVQTISCALTRAVMAPVSSKRRELFYSRISRSITQNAGRCFSATSG